LPSQDSITGIFLTGPSRQTDSGNFSSLCWAMHPHKGDRYGGQRIIATIIGTQINPEIRTRRNNGVSGGAM
jgi:hypothetical protein